ncbi:type I secretion system permease/ATPase [Sphingosinicella terrae]|uniref:type I secretion system permease/ATPase n=1 Tax=Sphingosinicella terrae TaxID=2172047 RepID=UPI000E0DDBF1|nr:type I secretion system permease/ATPase [Sphingosinicella terrae]
MGHRGRDDLVECLLLLAAEHGVTSTRDALTSGLPVEGSLTPALFPRAAERVGFTARLAETPIRDLNPALLPAVALLQDEHACIIHSVDPEAGTASIVFPELGSADRPVPLALEELEARYLGYAIYCRPAYRPDERVAAAPEEAEGHWFWDVIKGNRRLYADVLVAALFVNLFAMAMPLFVMNVYDRVVPNQATDTLWVLAAGILIVLVGDLALRHMRSWFVDAAAARADTRLSAHIMERVLGMRLEQRPASVGSYATSVQSFESVRSFIGSMTVLTLIDMPFFLLFALIIGLISFWMVLPLIVGTAIAILYALSVAARLSAISDEVSRAGAHRNATLVEGLYALETLKAFGATSRVQKVWEQATEYLSSQVARQRLLGSSVASVSAQIQQAVGCVLIIVGVYLVINGQISQGGMIAAYMLASRAMAPIAQTASLMTSFYQARTSLAQLDETVAQPQERPRGKSWISRPAINGDIAFRNVVFNYPGAEAEAVKGVSFHIRAGEKVGIIGRVGSGKSTLGKLLLGLYQPASGMVMVDGVHIGQIDPDELRRRIGYVPQEPLLLFGTVLDNIMLGARREQGDRNLAAALHVAGLTSMLGANAEGLDMQVGEGGNRLSGGQRQAIAIARAIAMDPSILVLDEPTSAMDGRLEGHVTRALAAYAEDRTMVLITHKPAMLDLVNRLIVIDDGKIVADGPKAAVLDSLNSGNIQKAAV